MVNVATIKQLGEYLSEGSTRTVYRMNGKIYKIDQHKTPRNNTNEYLNYIKYRASELICPIYNILEGGRIVEMAECIPLVSYLKNKFPKKISEIEHSVMNRDINIIVRDYGLLNDLEFDYSKVHKTFIKEGNLDYMEVMYGENWGVLNNKLVLLDYSR